MMLASKVANPLLQTIMQAISFVIPQMIMTASMQRGSGKTGGLMSKIPEPIRRGATTPVGVISGKTGGFTKYGQYLDDAATSGNKFKNVLSKIGFGLTRLNVGFAIGSLAVIGAVKAYKAHNEQLRIGALQYGLTAQAAEKAGLKYTDYNQKLADTVANIKALKERNQLLYESMQDAGTPISMTIEEYKKLRKEVKSVYADQIKLINQTDGGGNTKKLAQDLKIQLMAAGMSAEDATKKIWAMFKMSNKARDAASFTLGNSGFNKIETKQDAAARAVAGYSRSAAEGGREGAGSVNTGLTAIDTGIQDLIDKSKAANKKDKNKPILTEYEAQEKMLQRLNNLEASKAVLTRETINEMVKQNPELKKIINPMDTIVSLWGKMNLAAKGFTGDLSKLGAEAVSTLSKVADAISAATISENKEGLLKNQYEALERLTDQQKALMKAAKGQSAAQQINTREQLKGLQKQIDANNKLADARLKALDAAKQEGDIAREIAKKQAEYDSALATGNVAAAQQASLDIKGLQSDQQYNAQKKAIEDALKLKNAPLEAKIQAINDGQQKMSDKAALAGESLSKLNDKIAKQRQKIDDVNLAMTSLRLNAAALGLTIDDYVKTYDGKKAAAAVVASTNAAGAKIPTTSGSTGHPSSGVSSDVAAQALAILNTASDAVAKGLAAKGMEIKTMTGDIYINNKKMDVTPAKIPTSPPGVVVGNTMSTYKKEDMSLKEASKKAVTDKQSKQFIGASGDQYYLFKYGQIVYAVDKTTGAVKLFDEATKTTGKVVKFAPGGKVFGAGSSTSDSIPAMLSDGEYVFSARAVNNAGGPDAVDNLHNALKRADGGPIGKQKPQKQQLPFFPWRHDLPDYWSNGAPTGNPRTGRWGELRYNPSKGKDIWGGTEIPGLKFTGKTPQQSDYWHQMTEQPSKSRGPGMGLDRSPDRYAGSGASMGGIGSGAYGIVNSMFMAEGGKVSLSKFLLNQAKDLFGLGHTLGPLLNGPGVLRNLVQRFEQRDNVGKFQSDGSKISKSKNSQTVYLSVKNLADDDNAAQKKDNLQSIYKAANKLTEMSGISFKVLKPGTENKVAGQTVIPINFISKKSMQEHNPMAGGYTHSDLESDIYLRSARANNFLSLGRSGSIDVPIHEILHQIGAKYNKDSESSILGAAIKNHSKNPFNIMFPGEIGLPQYVANRDLENIRDTFGYYAYGDSLKKAIPKFENGINSVPANMLAMLHKNEAVVPANMNPFNPNANNATMGATYNITNNINGYDGDLNQLSNMVTQKTITAITAIDKISSKMVGNPMTVSINK
jgi:hypothetical protein